MDTDARSKHGRRWMASRQQPASLDFQPPIQTTLAPGAPVYLAYAPSDPQTLEERNELSGLGFNFGTELGTFHSDGRVYRYALLKELPCFPPPAQ